MKKQVAYLQKLFYDLWNDFGSAYLIVNHSDRTRIGKRGFTEEEKKQGLILVFNNRTNNRLEWDAEGNLSCVLAFGPRKEDVQVHHDDLRGVFSPEAGVQFLRGDGDAKPAARAEPDAGEDGAGQIVSLSTYRQRRRTSGTDEQQ
jgi:hypothetical protein